jgi:hypothetical protein
VFNIDLQQSVSLTYRDLNISDSWDIHKIVSIKCFPDALPYAALLEIEEGISTKTSKHYLMCEMVETAMKTGQKVQDCFRAKVLWSNSVSSSGPDEDSVEKNYYYLSNGVQILVANVSPVVSKTYVKKNSKQSLKSKDAKNQLSSINYRVYQYLPASNVSPMQLITERTVEVAGTSLIGLQSIQTLHDNGLFSDYVAFATCHCCMVVDAANSSNIWVNDVKQQGHFSAMKFHSISNINRVADHFQPFGLLVILTSSFDLHLTLFHHELSNDMGTAEAESILVGRSVTVPIPGNHALKDDVTTAVGSQIRKAAATQIEVIELDGNSYHYQLYILLSHRVYVYNVFLATQESSHSIKAAVHAKQELTVNYLTNVSSRYLVKSPCDSLPMSLHKLPATIIQQLDPHRLHLPSSREQKIVIGGDDGSLTVLIDSIHFPLHSQPSDRLSSSLSNIPCYHNSALQIKNTFSQWKLLNGTPTVHHMHNLSKKKVSSAVDHPLDGNRSKFVRRLLAFRCSNSNFACVSIDQYLFVYDLQGNNAFNHYVGTFVLPSSTDRREYWSSNDDCLGRCTADGLVSLLHQENGHISQYNMHLKLSFHRKRSSKTSRSVVTQVSDSVSRLSKSGKSRQSQDSKVHVSTNKHRVGVSIEVSSQQKSKSQSAGAVETDIVTFHILSFSCLPVLDCPSSLLLFITWKQMDTKVEDSTHLGYCTIYTSDASKKSIKVTEVHDINLVPSSRQNNLQQHSIFSPSFSILNESYVAIIVQNTWQLAVYKIGSDSLQLVRAFSMFIPNDVNSMMEDLQSSYYPQSEIAQSTFCFSELLIDQIHIEPILPGKSLVTLIATSSSELDADQSTCSLFLSEVSIHPITSSEQEIVESDGDETGDETVDETGDETVDESSRQEIVDIESPNLIFSYRIVLSAQNKLIDYAFLDNLGVFLYSQYFLLLDLSKYFRETSAKHQFLVQNVEEISIVKPYVIDQLSLISGNHWSSVSIKIVKAMPSMDYSVLLYYDGERLEKIDVGKI